MSVADIDYEQESADWRDLINARAGSLVPVWDNAEDKAWDDV